MTQNKGIQHGSGGALGQLMRVFLDLTQTIHSVVDFVGNINLD